MDTGYLLLRLRGCSVSGLLDKPGWRKTCTYSWNRLRRARVMLQASARVEYVIRTDSHEFGYEGEEKEYASSDCVALCLV